MKKNNPARSAGEKKFLLRFCPKKISWPWPTPPEYQMDRALTSLSWFAGLWHANIPWYNVPSEVNFKAGLCDKNNLQIN